MRCSTETTLKMPRPDYESEEHLTEEAKVAYLLAEVWSATPSKLPKFYKCDWALVIKTNIKALLEIKCRDIMPDQYDTVILSADKWTYLINIDRALGVPALFCVRFADKSIRYIRPSHQKGFLVKLGGRNDRQDWQDVEPVVHIPVDQMRIVKY